MLFELPWRIVLQAALKAVKPVIEGLIWSVAAKIILVHKIYRSTAVHQTWCTNFTKEGCQRELMTESLVRTLLYYFDIIIH